MGRARRGSGPGCAAALAPLFARAERLPWWAILAAAVAVAALVPFVSDNSGYVVRVAVNTVLFALLALGLNVVVGWAVLGLSTSASSRSTASARMPTRSMYSSEQFGLHFPALLSVAVVIVTSALLGLLLGLPSRRLLGDYLAIVTLFWRRSSSS